MPRHIRRRTCRRNGMNVLPRLNMSLSRQHNYQPTASTNLTPNPNQPTNQPEGNQTQTHNLQPTPLITPPDHKRPIKTKAQTPHRAHHRAQTPPTHPLRRIPQRNQRIRPAHGQIPAPRTKLQTKTRARMRMQRMQHLPHPHPRPRPRPR